MGQTSAPSPHCLSRSSLRTHACSLCRRQARVKFKERLALKMEHPGDRLDVQEDIELFSLARVRGGAAMDALLDGEEPDFADDDEDTAAAREPEVETESEEDSDEDAAARYTRKLDLQLEEMYTE